ncbi:unnamed protein product, partial [marine sediment metagenome]
LMTIAPEGGYASFGATDARPFFLDLEVTDWTTTGDQYRRYVADNTALNGSATDHTLGGFVASMLYTVRVDGVLGAGVAGGGVVRSEASGEATFTYTGNYADAVFELETALAGDFNGDGVVDATDINGLLREVHAGGGDLLYDVNGDGAVNATDADELIHTIMGKEYGDTDLDGDVDILDLDTLGINWDQSGMGWADGDFNGDTAADILDLDVLGSHWGGSASSPATRGQPAEPESILTSVPAVAVMSPEPTASVT